MPSRKVIPGRVPQVGDKVLLQGLDYPSFVVHEVQNGKVTVRLVRSIGQFTVIEVDHG